MAKQHSKLLWSQHNIPFEDFGVLKILTGNPRTRQACKKEIKKRLNALILVITRKPKNCRIVELHEPEPYHPERCHPPVGKRPQWDFSLFIHSPYVRQEHR